MMKPMNKLALALLAFLAAGSAVGIYRLYEMFYNVVLESKNVYHFKVQELAKIPTTRLRITGQLTNSSMVVRSVTEKKDGQAITVVAHLALVGLAKPKTVGGLDYEMVVPDSINEVRFGSDSTLVWKRTSLAHPPEQP